MTHLQQCLYKHTPHIYNSLTFNQLLLSRLLHTQYNTSTTTTTTVQCNKQHQLHQNRLYDALLHLQQSYNNITHQRALHTTTRLQHGSKPDPSAADITVTFIDSDGVEHTVTGKAGQSLLDVAHNNDIELEGACEGSLACSTCHVILTDDIYKQLDEPSDEENDMLDMAFGLTDTSRLGCQIILDEKLQGARFKIPDATRNMMVDGHKPKPH